MASSSFVASAALTALLAFSSPLFAQTEAPIVPAPAAEAETAVVKKEKPVVPKEKDYVILKVGSENVTYSKLQKIWKDLFPGGNAPDFATFDENVKQNVLRGIASERLLMQEAKKSGIDKSEKVKARLAEVQDQVVMQVFVDEKINSLVTEESIRAAYEEKIKAVQGKEEVKARHILVKTEDEAKTLAEQIKKGGDFEALAKEKSTDKASGAAGGDLGYFTQERMVPEFAKAAFALKKGEVSAPVKTDFGWHIIKLEDRRVVAAPTLEELRGKIREELANKAIQNYVEGLVAKADITYLDEQGKAKEFQKTPKAPAPTTDAPVADTAPAQ